MTTDQLRAWIELNEGGNLTLSKLEVRELLTLAVHLREKNQELAEKIEKGRAEHRSLGRMLANSAASVPMADRTPRLNGITLGPASPLLTSSGRARHLGPTEEDDQIALVELLVGPARRGEDRRPGDGLTTKHPELLLLYAIPNAGAGRSRGMAGRMKAMGALRGMPDLCLPVGRGPYIGLYVEMKRRGQRPRPEQRALHEALRAAGQCVLSVVGVEAGAAAILGYLALPANRPSLRPLGRVAGDLNLALGRWREACYGMLEPRQ